MLLAVGKFWIRNWFMCLMYYAINVDGQKWRIHEFSGGANSRGGTPTYYFELFLQKLHENETIWTERERASQAPPGSATELKHHNTRNCGKARFREKVCIVSSI